MDVSSHELFGHNQGLATIDEIIAANVRRVRKERLNLTQDRASEICGIPKRTYQRVEDGQTTSIPTIEMIAKGFGIETAELFQEVRTAPTKVAKSEALKALAEAAGLHIDGRITESPPAQALSDRDRRILEVFRGLNDEDLNFILEDVVPDVKAGLDRRAPNTGESARITRKPQKG